MKRTFDGLRAILGDVNPSLEDVAGPPLVPAERAASEPGGNPTLDLELRAPSPTAQDSIPVAAGVAATADYFQPVAGNETPAVTEGPREEPGSKEHPGEPGISDIPLEMQGDASGSEQPEAAVSGLSADAPIDDLGLSELDRGVYDGDSPAGPADIRARSETAAPVPADEQPRAGVSATVDDASLLDLDDGIFDGDGGRARRHPIASPASEPVSTPVSSADPEGLNGLDFSAQALDDWERPDAERDVRSRRRRSIDPNPSQPPLGTLLIHPDAGKTPFEEEDGPPAQAHGILMGHVNEWTAAIVLILSMFLGASAAVAVFHERVSQLFVKLG